MLGQAWTAHAKAVFILSPSVKAIRRKKGRRNAGKRRRRRMVQASSFSVFSRAFCAVKLCQGNTDEGGRYQRRALFFFLFFYTSPSIFLSVLYDSLPYLFLFPKLTLSTFDDSSQNGSQYSVEVHLQQANQWS